MGMPIEPQRDLEELSDALEGSEPESPTPTNPPLGALELGGVVVLDYTD